MEGFVVEELQWIGEIPDLNPTLQEPLLAEHKFPKTQ